MVSTFNNIRLDYYGNANLPLGHMNFGRFDYADESGYNLDNQVLVFKISF